MEEIKPHKLMVPRGDRSHAIIEPFLTDQWYVKTAPLAGPAIAAVKTGKIKFIPENWEKTYFDWMNRIEDWCISRQIWWGHRIPAWYDEQGQVYVGRDEAEIREKHQLGPESESHPRPRRAGHLVFLGAVAVFDAGLAGKHRGAQDLLPDQRAGHRLRHHFLLGGPDDHDGPEVHGRCAVPRGLHPRPGARSGRPEDVEIQGQRARPARFDRRRGPG
jgi:hypothetical protein